MGPKFLTTLLALLFIIMGFCSTTAADPPKHPPEPTKPFDFASSPSSKIHREFLATAMELILKKGVFQEAQTKRIPYYLPDELKTKLDVSLSEDFSNFHQLKKVLEDLFEVSPRPGHKFRMSKRIAGLDPLAVAGDWMAATMSNLVVTYLVAPIWSMMEIEMAKYLSRQIGWAREGAMVPTSGAGAANSMALSVAMHHHDPFVRDIGLAHYTKKLMIYVSEFASISWSTAAIYNGFGTDNLAVIYTDIYGRMDPRDLEDRLKLNTDTEIPFMVVATAGTPLFGTIDNLEEIGKVCEKFQVWFHVDAEKAGGYLFTSQPTEKLSGISRADSVTVGMWLFAAPYTSTMVLTKAPLAMQRTFGLHASYVFTGIDHYNHTYDRGDQTIQTSRRPEISKIWFAAARGEQYSRLMFLEMDKVKLEFMLELNRREGFSAIKAGWNVGNSFQVPMVSFRYVPKNLRNIPEISEEFLLGMDETGRTVKKILQRQGLIDLSLSYLPGQPASFHAFYTVSFTNTRFTGKDIPFVLDTIAKIAEGGIIDENYNFPVEPAPETSTVNFPNFPYETLYGRFLFGILNTSLEEGLFFPRTSRVFDLKQPKDLPYDFTLPQPANKILEAVQDDYKKIISLSPHWAHPYWIYQLAAGLDPFTLVADYISPVLNTPMLSYEDSGPFMLMEKELIRQMVKRVYKSDVGDGIITDGGSMANQIAIAMAKYSVTGENFKKMGYRAFWGKKYVIFTSGDAHYSTKKGAIFQGIGQNYTIEVQSNNIGQMRADILEEAILKTRADGNIPLMVVITTGTTIYGAIDPIDAIIDICKKHGNIWAHIDGMFGGLAVMSDTHIAKFKGIERSDSWGADLHKLMGSTMVCSILITQWPGFFEDVFSLPDMLQEEPYADNTLNLIGRHSQMDKRNNIFKFWLLWKAKGRKGLGLHVDKIMSNKDYLIKEIKRRKAEGFELVIENYDLTNVCFRYIPEKLRGGDRNSPAWKSAMDIVAFAIEKEFIKNGVMSFVSQHRHEADGGNTVNFLKFVMMGSALVEADIDFMLNSVAYYGARVEWEDQGRYPARWDEHRHVFDAFGNLPEYVPFDPKRKWLTNELPAAEL